MKSIHIRLLLPVIMIFITLSVTAQINSSPGYMHGTNKKGDTAAKSEYNADKAPKKDGADTTVISRRSTPASEARAERRSGAGGNGNASDAAGTDTMPQVATTTEPSGTATTTTETTTTACGENCAHPAWRYAGIGFGILSLVLLLVLLLRNRKDGDNRPGARV